MPYRHLNAAEHQVIQRHRRPRNHRPLRSVVLSGTGRRLVPRDRQRASVSALSEHPKMRISAETIYQPVYRDAARGAQLYR